MSDAVFGTQAAIAAVLGADAGMQAVLGVPVRLYDHVPPDTAYPFASFGPAHIAPYDDKVATGFRQVVTVDVWSRYRGGKECRDVFQALYAALHRATLAVAGQVFLACEFHDADLGVAEDGMTYRAAVRFAVTVQDE